LNSYTLETCKVLANVQIEYKGYKPTFIMDGLLHVRVCERAKLSTMGDVGFQQKSFRRW